ncbi:MAG: hypothetical protein JO042_00065 [Sinobacteraceae bacterium]|nr:hypothetical protein [Nevskiaceae bacterium]
MNGPAQGADNEEMFERQTRKLLEDSVLRIDGRIRSRLNQARHAAIEEATRRPSWLRRFFLMMPAARMMPASAVAAAVLVAFVMWPHPHQVQQAVSIADWGARPGEDLEMLADSEAFDMVSDETDGGAFYEWAADQADSSEPGATGA